MLHSPIQICSDSIKGMIVITRQGEVGGSIRNVSVIY